jgi:UDP-N-acetylmuramyl pentapeptide phosphotransferase/UDP-N-acetylglucosamine-1-phosphate transferase
MLLQRYLAFGSFPKGYRGWFDAYQNYDQMIRHGSSKAYWVAPVVEKGYIKRIPIDPIVWFGTSFLASIPLVAVVLMWVIASVNIAKGEIGLYTGLVVLTSCLLAAFYAWVARQTYELTRGQENVPLPGYRVRQDSGACSTVQPVVQRTTGLSFHGASRDSG